MPSTRTIQWTGSPSVGLLFAFVVLLSGACVLSENRVQSAAIKYESEARFATTYEKLLPLAEAGDPEVQNLLGFMFYHGEGVARDFEEAHLWFHRAADEGNLNAAWNLGVLHSGVLSEVPDYFHDNEEATFWIDFATSQDMRVPNDSQALDAGRLAPSEVAAGATLRKGDLDIGSKVYRTFCAGCHGFDGIAVYPGAPSFALGERLDSSDEELIRHISEGIGDMSRWGETLSPQLLAFTVASIRAQFGADATGQYEEPRDPALDRASSSDPESRGEHLYMTFCAGCHGFNGVAYYVHSPSFAMGDALGKSDLELQRSIARGVGPMPGWDAMLSPDELRDIVAFIRTLRMRYEDGVSGQLKDAPDRYFLFRSDAKLGSQDRGTARR